MRRAVVSTLAPLLLLVCIDKPESALLVTECERVQALGQCEPARRVAPACQINLFRAEEIDAFAQQVADTRLALVQQPEAVSVLVRRSAF